MSEKNAKNRINERSMYGKAGIDIHLFVIVILLLLLGLIAMYTSSYASAYYKYGNSYHYVINQFIYSVVGVIAMLAISKFLSIKLLKKLTPLAYVASIVLLLLVPFIGVVRNGAKRWLEVGPISVQPSEIGKIALVLMMSLVIVNFGPKKMATLKFGVIGMGLIMLPIVGLVLIEKHLSATIILCLIAAVLMYVGGTKPRYFLIVAGAGVALVGIVLLVAPYTMSRVQIWFDPWKDSLGKGYQTIQSLLAIGSGGLFGVGLGQSRQKHMYIPEPQNDFIFSIWCEELGFVGALIVILLFALLIWRGIVIAMRAPDKFSGLVVIGLVAKLAWQVIFNIGVVTNTVPNTGISLPFFSYGGTALILQLCEMGIILAISKYSVITKE